jgi:hypothetical protein
MQQNKEAEAKEELKRRAKQLEMQRREQQKRAASSGGANNYLGGGVSGYSPVTQRFDAPEPSASRMKTSPAPSARSPAFKGTGMKLGSKKTKQAELLDALGGEVLANTTAASELSVPPPSAAVPEPTVQKTGRGSLPEVTAER